MKRLGVVLLGLSLVLSFSSKALAMWVLTDWVYMEELTYEAVWNGTDYDLYDDGYECNGEDSCEAVRDVLDRNFMGDNVWLTSYNIDNHTPYDLVGFAIGIPSNVAESVYYTSGWNLVMRTRSGWGGDIATPSTYDDIISQGGWYDILSPYSFEELFPGYDFALMVGLDLTDAENFNPILSYTTSYYEFVLPYGEGVPQSPVVVVTKDPNSGSYNVSQGNSGQRVPVNGPSNTVVPEPASASLLLLGLIGLAERRRRR